MPELPEVETIKRQLQKSLIGKKIKEISVRMDKMIKIGPGKISNIKKGSKQQSKKFAEILNGKKILDVQRRAKFLIIKLSSDFYLLIHLRMSGQLIYVQKRNLQTPLALSLAKNALKQKLPGKHTHIEFTFLNGDKLFYNDTRQFGHMRLASSEELTAVMSEANLGPEPLSLQLADFKNLLKQHRHKRIKDFLLNQNIIAGIGNIYADEALFSAKISPLRTAGKIKNTEAIALHASLQKILNRAIALGGSSVESFLMANGMAGKFSSQHSVYARAGKPCLICGKILISKKIGSRTSTFCQYCQF